MTRESESLDKLIGTHIRRHRKRNRVSQEALAGAIGISYQQLQKYEYGRNRVPASRLYYIAKALGVDLMAFFEGAAASANESSAPPKSTRSLFA